MSQANGNGKSLLLQGRLLWTSGNLFTGKQKVNMQTKQVIIDQKTGLPTIVYGFGLAIPKIDPRTNQFTAQWVELYQALHAEAMTLFPSGQVPPTFAMKYKDGDVDVDESGKRYADREGYAGHIILACTTMIPIKYFVFQGNNNVLVNDGFKCGDYVEVQVNLKAHPAAGTAKAGMYVNPTAVRLIQPGKEIINTPSGDQLFGTNAPNYSGQVIAPEMGSMPQMNNQAGGPPMPGQNNYNQPPVNNGYNQAPPQNNGYQQQPANNTPNPHYDVLPPGMQPNNGGQQNNGYQQQPPVNNGYNQAPPQNNGMPPMNNNQGGQQNYNQPPVNNGGMPPLPQR